MIPYNLIWFVFEVPTVNTNRASKALLRSCRTSFPSSFREISSAWGTFIPLPRIWMLAALNSRWKVIIDYDAAKACRYKEDRSIYLCSLMLRRTVVFMDNYILKLTSTGIWFFRPADSNQRRKLRFCCRCQYKTRQTSLGIPRGSLQDMACALLSSQSYRTENRQ